jgi:signal transduction histidine kinase
MSAYETELEFLLEREKTIKEICAELNNFTDLRKTLQSIINHIKVLVRCEIIGIRLKEQGDFPYYVHEGYSKEFLILENSLCKKDAKGNKICDAGKKRYMLECMCGNVLQGRVDSTHDFFTEKGSFWTNDVTLFSTTAKNKGVGELRNVCNKFGCNSIALIPIKSRDEIVGLIQLNSYKKDMFSRDLIGYLEAIGEQVGLAIHNNIIFEKLQKQLEQEQKLVKEKESLDLAKTEFFANITHELKTPINILLGAIQVIDFKITQGQEENFSEKLCSYLNMMKQNSYRLLRLVNNIIDQSKVDSGFLKLNLRNFNIINVIESITLSIADYAKNKGIELIFDTETEEKVMAIDDYKLERIMLNLLSNAIKFTDQGGQILVNIKDKDDKVLIHIKDTGIGIPEDKLSIIFDRFGQVDKTLARNREGSGIGLSLVKSFVNMHEGSISVSSKYGEGSEFIIEFPVRVVEEEDVVLENHLYGNNVEKINIEFCDLYNY